MDELISEGIEEIQDTERPTIFTDIDIRNGASIPKNSLVEVKWRDASQHRDVDIKNLLPSYFLVESLTFGKLVGNDENAIAISTNIYFHEQNQPEFLHEIMCIPKGWIDHIKIIGRD